MRIHLFTYSSKRIYTILALVLVCSLALQAQDIWGGASPAEDIVGGAGAGSVFSSRNIPKSQKRPGKPAVATRRKSTSAPRKRGVAQTTPRITPPPDRTVTAQEAAETFTEQGNNLFNAGQYDKAVAAYSQATRVKPDYADAYFGLGDAYDMLNRRDEAIKAYQQAVQLKPDLTEAHYSLGVIYYEDAKYDLAIASLNQAIKLRADHPDSYNYLGLALQKSNRLPDAVAQYQKAIQLKPEFAQAHYNLGDVLYELAISPTSRKRCWLTIPRTFDGRLPRPQG